MIKRPYKLLVIDDEEALLNILKQYLEQKYSDTLQVFITPNPLIGLEIVKNEDINIAFVDLSMPEMSGDKVLREIKSMKQECEVIILTGSSSFALCSACFYDGALSYLKKPFDFDELENVVNMAIQKFDYWSRIINKVVDTRKE